MFFPLLKKELRCLLRARQWPLAVILFSLVLVVLASFAFRRLGLGERELLELTPGILWTIFLFCGVMSLNYSFFHEEEFGGLTGLALSPAEPMMIYLAKLSVNWLFLVFISAFIVATHALFFGAAIAGNIVDLLAVFALIAFGFCSLGTLFAAMSISVRGREILLPLLLFPFSLPLLAAGVHLTNEVLALSDPATQQPWLLLSLTFDVIAVTLSTVLFEFVIRD